MRVGNALLEFVIGKRARHTVDLRVARRPQDFDSRRMNALQQKELDFLLVGRGFEHGTVSDSVKGHSHSVSKSFVNAKVKRRQYRRTPSEADKVHG